MTTFDIKQFLERYKEYPCLWDKSSPEFMNRYKREHAEAALMKLCHLGSLKLLRTKIRSIRGTYNGELRKIRDSLTASGLVYRPKLHWFKLADSFLRKIYVQNPQADYNLMVDNIGTSVESNEITTSSKSTSYKPSRTKTTRREAKSLRNICTSEMVLRKDTCTTKSVANMPVHNNEFMVFGQSVGIQMTKLPLHIALQVQQEIQSIITTARLAELNSMDSIPNTMPSITAQHYTHSTTTPYLRSSTHLFSETDKFENVEERKTHEELDMENVHNNMDPRNHTYYVSWKKQYH